MIAALKQRIESLEEHLRLDRVRRFGPSSEKNPHQCELLFNEAETIEEAAEAAAALEAVQDPTNTPKKRGRKGLSKQLPRHQVHITLPDEEKAGAVETFLYCR